MLLIIEECIEATLDKIEDLEQEQAKQEVCNTR